MSDTIEQQLDEMLHKASVSFVRNMLRTDADLAEFKAIDEDVSGKQEQMNLLYTEEYYTRVDEVRKRLYDEAAQANLDHPAPPGGGNDRVGFIETEAHRRVRQAHANDMQGVRDEGQQAFEDLLGRAQRRNQTKGMAVDAFLRASERRSGEDRRTIRHSQD
ncbi:hypothetical protein [Mesorhizobium sp. CN2-181]|uniref:hypothetical protein n=1 Tax=Mesorhizobium yinganensis TaxID=3157707 RepID=UPI0032B83B0C